MTTIDAQSESPLLWGEPHADSPEQYVRQLVERNQQFNRRQYGRYEGTAISTVGVVGAGFMGGTIAAVAISHGMGIVINDVDQQALAQVPARIQSALLDMGQADATTGSTLIQRYVRTTSDLTEVARCDVIVEAVVENPFVKRQIFRELEQHCRPETIIVSNTSALPIASLASEMTNPTRFCGLHYLSAIVERSILEIIPGPQTSAAAAATVVGFTESLGRIPLVVQDGLGFVVNRLLLAYMNAGMTLLLAGVDMQRIDRIATDFGMRMGPLRAYDEVGLDVAFKVGFALVAESDKLVVRSPVLVRLIKEKQLGRKTGAGFYLHDPGPTVRQSRRVNPRARSLIERLVEATEPRLTDEQIADAILLPMLLEGTRLLEQDRVRDAAQIDLAVTYGLGFPIARGGLMYWGQQWGARTIVERLQALAPLGPHLSPTPLLMAALR